MKYIQTWPGKQPGNAAAIVSLLVALTISGCSTGGGGGNYNPPQQPAEPQPELTDIINESLERLQCIVDDELFADCDGDGVVNYADVVPTRDDNGDDDGDLVLNNRDRWEGVDDKQLDVDSDGTPDYLDTFFGNNYGDEDGDGLQNGIDAQPYTAPPTGTATLPSANYTHDIVTQSLLDAQVRRTYMALYSPVADRDLDGYVDQVGIRPTGSTNDYDGDNDPDWYDPYPTDGFVNSYNDPWDPSNDEYWED